jgi:hypothetical protein
MMEGLYLNAASKQLTGKGDALRKKTYKVIGTVLLATGTHACRIICEPTITGFFRETVFCPLRKRPGWMTLSVDKVVRRGATGRNRERENKAGD